MENNSTFAIGEFVFLQIEAQNQKEGDENKSKKYQVIEYNQTENEYLIRLDEKNTSWFKTFELKKIQ